MRYVDADYGRDMDDRRSTTCYVLTLGGGPISWKSMVQSLAVLSTTKLGNMTVARPDKI